MSSLNKRSMRKRCAVAYVVSSSESEGEPTPKKKQKYFYYNQTFYLN